MSVARPIFWIYSIYDHGNMIAYVRKVESVYAAHRSREKWRHDKVVTSPQWRATLSSGIAHCIKSFCPLWHIKIRQSYSFKHKIRCLGNFQSCEVLFGIQMFLAISSFWSMMIAAKRQVVEYFIGFGRSGDSYRRVQFSKVLADRDIQFRCPRAKRQPVYVQSTTMVMNSKNVFLQQKLYISVGVFCCCDTAKWILRCVPCINQLLIYFSSFCWV